MQNCSLTCNEEASIPNTSHSNEIVPNTRLPKQGLKNLNGKDFSCQASQKGKQTGTAKGNNSSDSHNQRNIIIVHNSTSPLHMLSII